jgi:hypothetical protein
MKSFKREFYHGIEYINNQGRLHREDGPARIWNNGSKFWYLNGLNYSEQDWETKVTELKLKRILDL